MALHKRIRQAGGKLLAHAKSDAAYYKDAEKIEGTEEVRTPIGSSSDFLKSQPK